jgi:hypothetical protein
MKRIDENPYKAPATHRRHRRRIHPITKVLYMGFAAFFIGTTITITLAVFCL